eukprot:NODE_17_length_48642_cov_1.199349.p14 type:complete len:371 gc:universal NODE_17_length_48642_cov_1.199349:32600-33712(+)
MREQQTKVQLNSTTQVGGDLSKKLKEAASTGEPAWKIVDQNNIGMYIWRIEKFQPKAVPKEQHGKFYDGDSYLVLNAYKTTGSNTLKYDLHFWLGTETSQDEAGTAAYKTVELDDFLGGAPVQYREVQGSESSLFLSYFPVFLVQHGGVDSGFTKVKPVDYKPRLLHVKGSRKKLVVRQVELHTDSMNSGDVFILDAGLEIYQWNGEKAAAWEKNKANELVRSIQQERLGKPKTFVFDEADKNISDFYTKLGSNGKIKSAEEGGDDNSVAVLPKKIYRLSDASGSMQFSDETLSTGKLARSQLDQNDVFVIDNGTEVFVWIGKATTAEERAQGLQYAEKYLKEFNRPMTTPICKVNAGNESEFFWKSFDA